MAIDIEIPIELMDRGQYSATSEKSSYYDSIKLDPSNYVGDTVEYYLEVNASNLDTVDSSVMFRQGTNTIATCTIPAGAEKQRIRSEAFTPLTGNLTYHVRIGATTEEKDMWLWNTRLIIIMKGATTARVAVPLVHYDYAADAGSPAVGTNSETYTQYLDSEFQWWTKDSGVYADLNGETPYTLECYMGAGTGVTGYMSLFNVDTDTQVGDSEISITNSSAVVTKSFADTADNFTDDDVFEVRVKATGGSMYASSARLYINLTNLSKAQVPHRVCRMKYPDHIQATTHETHKVLMVNENYSNPVFYFDTSGYCADEGTGFYLCYDAATPTADSGTYHPYLAINWDGIPDTDAPISYVTGSRLIFNSATKVKRRSDALTLVSGYRYFTEKEAPTNDFTAAGAFILVNTSEEPTPDPDPDPDPAPVPSTLSGGAGFVERGHGWV